MLDGGAGRSAGNEGIKTRVLCLFQQAVERKSSVNSPVSLDGKRVPGLQAYQSVQEYLRQDEWSILMQITPLAGRGVR